MGEEETDSQLIESAKENNLSEEEVILKLREMYSLIIKILKKYCDLKEEYYSLISIWIIGTYFHKKFLTYPYLFFNAMKGSGKSRVLKLITKLAWNGRLMNNLSEAVLFRTASQRTLGIDEFEGVGSKDKAALRELLNSAYKKGTFVERAVKVKTNTEEKYRIDTFDLYCPIVMANIWGMDETLSDRCISLILDKSSKKEITLLLENFETCNYTNSLIKCSCVVTNANLGCIEGYMEDWNDYVSREYDTNYTTTLITLPTPNYTKLHYNLFKRILDTKIDSRHLELFFPLFILAGIIGDDIFEKILETAKVLVKARKDDDIMENRDVSFIDFIVSSEIKLKNQAEDEFISEKTILNSFKDWMDFDEKNEEFKWLNGKWIGRAMKRLNFVVEKKRHSFGFLVKINFKIARQKRTMFETKEQDIEMEKI